MTGTEYAALAQGMSRQDVVDAWALIGSAQSPVGWPPGRAFEHLILRQFQIEGARVVWPFKVELHDQVIEQIDGAIYFNGIAFLVEAKDQADPVSFEPIAKLTTQLLRHPLSTLGLVFSRSGFTEPAKTLALYSPPVRILLWEYEDIDTAIRNRSMTAFLRRKCEMAAERAMPDFMVSREMLV